VKRPEIENEGQRDIKFIGRRTTGSVMGDSSVWSSLLKQNMVVQLWSVSEIHVIDTIRRWRRRQRAMRE